MIEFCVCRSISLYCINSNANKYCRAFSTSDLCLQLSSISLMGFVVSWKYFELEMPHKTDTSEVSPRWTDTCSSITISLGCQISLSTHKISSDGFVVLKWHFSVINFAATNNTHGKNRMTSEKFFMFQIADVKDYIM